jgi:hypothetical protein
MRSRDGGLGYCLEWIVEEIPLAEALLKGALENWRICVRGFSHG